MGNALFLLQPGSGSLSDNRVVMNLTCFNGTLRVELLNIQTFIILIKLYWIKSTCQNVDSSEPNSAASFILTWFVLHVFFMLGMFFNI